MRGPIRHPLGDFLPSSIPCVLGAHRPPSLSCMRAAQITRFGGPEVPDIVDVPEPEAGPGQRLYDVSDAGVNFPETHHRGGAQQTV